MRGALDVGLCMLAGKTLKLTTLCSYSSPTPSFVPFNPKELFLKARGPGFDHNVRAEGEMALTFISSSCTISKLQTAGPHAWASITPIM